MKIDLEQLDELEKLEKKATGGVWERTSGIRAGGTLLVEKHGYLNEVQDDSNLDFIVAMRNALPDLIRLARAGMELRNDPAFKPGVGHAPRCTTRIKAALADYDEVVEGKTVTYIVENVALAKAIAKEAGVEEPTDV